MPKKISNKTKKLIRSYYGQGKTGIEVAELCNVSDATVSRVWNKMHPSTVIEVKEQLFPDPFQKLEAAQKDYEKEIIEFIRVMYTTEHGKLIDENSKLQQQVETLSRENAALRQVADEAKRSNLVTNLQRHFGIIPPVEVIRNQ